MDLISSILIQCMNLVDLLELSYPCIPGMCLQTLVQIYRTLEEDARLEGTCWGFNIRDS